MPLVQLRLQAIAFCEQRAVLGGEVVDEGIETFPEGFAVDASPAQRLIVDKFAENSRDSQPRVLCSIISPIMCSNSFKYLIISR